MSFRKTFSIALLAIMTFSAVFVAAPDAEARSLTSIARQNAISHHRNAAQMTQRATALNARLPAEAAKFAAGVNSGNYNRKLYAKRAYINYLNSLKRAVAYADRAHAQAILAFQHYVRVSKNTSANATINSLVAARNGFTVTIGQIDARIVNAQNA